MILTLNRKRITVVSIAEAQLKVHEESTRVGSTEFYARNPRNGCALTSGDELLGRISYNARFWPATDSNPTSTHDSPKPERSNTMNPKSKLPKSTAKAPKAKKLPKVTEKGHATVQDAAPVEATPVATEVAAPEVVTTASKKAAAKKEKAPREPKAPKEDLMTFAFRLSKDESEAIHKAAGPGKASKFARTLLVAAARRDNAAIDEILKSVASAS